MLSFLFPRHQKRGLIEASSRCAHRPQAVEFPRHQKRGLIEAVPLNHGLGLAPHFRAIKSAVSLKRIRPHPPESPTANFRAIKSAVSLKLVRDFPLGVYTTDFRAIKSAVSLKLDVLFAKIECMGDFRAIKSAVSLKQRRLRSMESRLAKFPRHQKRGLIEAGTLKGPLHGGADFRAIKSAVSLKRVDGADGSCAACGFPRHQKRGLIEARICLWMGVGCWLYFRAIKSAVSLKRGDAESDARQGYDFRAIKSAVSLKLGASGAGNDPDGGFPRHQKRGLIEASSTHRTASPYAPDFRAIKSAVSLKRGGRCHPHPDTAHFRAIKSAVSLKRRGGRGMCGSLRVFPRHQKRGLIEASSMACSTERRETHFRAIKSAVSLKRIGWCRAMSIDGRFPRHQKRGLIEASKAGSGRYSPTIFPRHQKRGLIEARIGLPRRRMGTHFRAIKSAVSLKQDGLRTTLQTTVPNFRAIKSAVSLKHPIGACGLGGLGRFPRHQKRGLIEALSRRNRAKNTSAFPRHQKRGLIEARPSGISRTLRIGISAPSKARSH